MQDLQQALTGNKEDKRNEDRIRSMYNEDLKEIDVLVLAQEIIDNAVSASTRDPRFDPIRPDELKWLEISVDVLGDPEPVSSPDELDVKRYGVIVTKGRKRGLLLPDLDGVDTVEEQISIAKSKAGIADWDKRVELQRFEVVRHH